MKIARTTLIILCVVFFTSCSQPISYKRTHTLLDFDGSSCKTSNLQKKNYKNIWVNLRDGFCLDIVYSSRVEKEIKWFVNNKDFLYRSISRAEPFLYHIIQRLQKNNLPLELALLPIIESGYQPYAYSPSSAAGIWQFIPATAKEYGLSRNWWYDGRRDIIESTDAAIHFLSDMHRHFHGDWFLAIASYNTGAGKVGRAIKKSNTFTGSANFWDLKLPRETEIYVPKLIALRDIILDPSSYGIKLPPIKNKPLTSFARIQYPIDFYTLSILTNVSQDKLYKLNPGFSTWLLLPEMQNKIILPKGKNKNFYKKYKEITKHIFTQKIHLITKGDSLYSISRLYNVSIKSLMKLNNLKSDLIIAGKKLRLPIDTTKPDIEYITVNSKKYFISNKSFTYKHTIKRYDNWYKIAKFYNVTLSKLLRWNKATKKTKLKVGQQIKIIMKTPILSPTKKIKLRYVVNSGDTASMLSNGFGIEKEHLVKTNSLKNSRYLTAGKSLLIPIKQ